MYLECAALLLARLIRCGTLSMTNLRFQTASFIFWVLSPTLPVEHVDNSHYPYPMSTRLAACGTPLQPQNIKRSTKTSWRCVFSPRSSCPTLSASSADPSRRKSPLSPPWSITLWHPKPFATIPVPRPLCAIRPEPLPRREPCDKVSRWTFQSRCKACLPISRAGTSRATQESFVLARGIKYKLIPQVTVHVPRLVHILQTR